MNHCKFSQQLTTVVVLCVVLLSACAGKRPSHSKSTEYVLPPISEPVTIQHYQNESEPKWMTFVERGDEAARHKQWGEAAYSYNHALDVIADPRETPQAPSNAEIERIYQFASRAQMLAGNLNATRTRSGLSGTMRSTIRGFVPVARTLPIQFDIDKDTLNSAGQEAAQVLADFVKEGGYTNIALIGHTDQTGSRSYNQGLSERRAETVKTFLKQAGVTADITTQGRGEDEPSSLIEPGDSPDEINRINRRVESITN